MRGTESREYEQFLAEIKRLLLGKDLREAWVEELIETDTPYLQKAFKDGRQPVDCAFEIYITEEESAREPIPEDHRLKLDVPNRAMAYLQQLVEIGLWGETVEQVATSLIQQQLASKLEIGFLRRTEIRAKRP